MTSPQKRKGSSAELAVAKWLRTWGWVNAERSRAGWTDDRGDIDGVPGVCIEVKNCKSIDIPGWLGELDVEMDNAGGCDAVSGELGCVSGGVGSVSGGAGIVVGGGGTVAGGCAGGGDGGSVVVVVAGTVEVVVVEVVDVDA